MNKKKRSATLVVILFSAGVLAASALLVPSLMNSVVFAKNSSSIQGSNKLALSESTIPVLKVEAASASIHHTTRPVSTDDSSANPANL